MERLLKFYAPAAVVEFRRLDARQAQELALQLAAERGLRLGRREAEMLANQLGEKPAVLLDEIFAELDRDRGRFLVEQLEPDYQVFIATAKDDDVSVSDGFRRFRVEAGRVMAD